MPRKYNLPHSDTELKLRAQIAANTSWANTSDAGRNRGFQSGPGRRRLPGNGENFLYWDQRHPYTKTLQVFVKLSVWRRPQSRLIC